MRNNKFKSGCYTYGVSILALLAIVNTATAQVYTGKVKGKKADISSQVTVGTGANISTITGSGFAGDGSGLYNITAAGIGAGSLGAGVIASSIAVGAVQDASIVGVSGSKVSGNISGNAANITGNLAGSQVSGNIPGNAANITGNLAASQVAAGSLGSGVIASSIAVDTVYTNSIKSLAVTDAKIDSMAATKLTGTIDNARLDSASVTLQGNTFNGASQLVKLGADGKLPVLDGSNLTNVTAVRQYKALSGYNGTLGVGTTFFSYAPSEDVTVSKIIVTIVEAGEDGISAGTVWKCGSTAGNSLSVTSTIGAAPGTKFTASGTVSVSSGVSFGGWMDTSDEDITPSANVVCEFK